MVCPDNRLLYSMGMSEDYEGDTLEVFCMHSFCTEMVSERTMDG